MRKIWVFLVPIIVQCSQMEGEQMKTEIIYKTDTVFIESYVNEEKYPWDLVCIDSSNTQTDMNFCSKECSIIADSLNERMYVDILNLFDKKIESSVEINYYLGQKARIKTIHEHFKIIRKTAADYKYAAYEGGTLAPLMYNTTKTWISEIEFELLTDLIIEVEQ